MTLKEKPGDVCHLIPMDDIWRERLHDERVAKDASKRQYCLLTVYDNAEGEECRTLDITGADEMADEIRARYNDPDALEVTLYRKIESQGLKCA